MIGFDVRRHFGLNFVCVQRRRATSNVRLDLAGLRGGMPPKQKKQYDQLQQKGLRAAGIPVDVRTVALQSGNQKGIQYVCQFDGQ